MPRPSAVFMGTPAIAVPALRTLAAQADVRAVITQPDRPAGRGMRLTAPPVKQAALDLGLPVWQPERLRGAEADERLHGHDLFVVMAYGELLRPAMLALPRACINLHASLLPRWRGASPLQACLRGGDAETGISVMTMVPALDAGPVHLQERFSLPPDATLPWLHDRMAEAASVALGRFLAAWPEVPPGIAQDETQVTVCRKLTAEDGHLDWTQTAAELDRWVRAYTPTPGCWTLFGGDRMRILALQPAPCALPPGVIAAHEGHLHIGCGDGGVEILRLQPPGRLAMDAADWLRGHRPPSLAS